MILIEGFIERFEPVFGSQRDLQPWLFVEQIPQLIRDTLNQLSDEYHVEDDIAIHKTAQVESGTILKAPLILGKGVFVAAHAYLRGGVFVGDYTTIGPGCEIKTSLLFNHSAMAHFNFIGDSIIGSHVNLEAGAVIANHFNEKSGADKLIKVTHNSLSLETGVTKFGAMVGDGSRIGANAVLCPGTLLPKQSIVKRLELVDQQIL